MLTKSLILMSGGALGTLSRFLLGIFFQAFLPLGFLPATLMINVIGCALIGFFYGIGIQKDLMDHHVILFFSVGFCGAFTTFSTFILETHQLSQANLWQPLLYILLSLVVGYFAFILANAAVNMWVH